MMLMEKKVRKPRGGTRSKEERMEILIAKQKFHQDHIDKIEIEKEKLRNPEPRVRIRKTLSDEDKQALELIRKSGKTYAELAEMLKD